ncbi:coronatine-insensitive protein 1-like [Cynara cardunculus var. scolymus]|nr:coronatine-insensitive protein 1-like [Cynara cardunculus var. scolymus]
MEEDLKDCRVENESTDTVFNCVVPYIHDGRDRNSFSLVCRKWSELDGTTRKHVTVHMCYSTTPFRLRQRFPLLESLTLKGKPRAAMWDLVPEDWGGYVTPWVREISSSFNCLKSIHFRRMIVRDSDLELLSRTRGKELRVLKIDVCSGFSTDGLLHIGRYCNNLKILYLQESLIVEKDGKWLHELALHNTCIESLNFYMTDLVKFDFKDLEIIARTCSESLVSVKISECELMDLVDFFSHAIKLQDFGGGAFSDQPEKYAGFKFPQKLHSVALNYMSQSEIPIVIPFAHQLTELDLLYSLFDTEDHCFLIQRCPNLKVLYARDAIGDIGLQIVGQFCKKLRRIKIERGADEEGLVSHRGLISLAQGCLELECLHVNVTDISNEAMECIGSHLKNLYDFRIVLLDKLEKIPDLPLDNGIRSLLSGCTKLGRLCVYLRRGGLTDVGLGYIGKYGQNVRYLLLGFTGESDAGLVELSKGCPNLQKLEMRGCAFSEQALASFVFNVGSLRYLWVQGYRASASGRDILAMARPFWNMELIRSVGDAPESSFQQQPPSLLAYYSLAGQRTDFPDSVLPLHPSLDL